MSNDNSFNDVILNMLDKKIERLEQEKKILEQQVLYWRIESNSYEARWIQALEDLDKYYKQQATKKDDGLNS